MLQLRQVESEINTLGIKVFVVTFDADILAVNYIEQTKLPWPLLLDSSRSLYRWYGMERGTWWQILNPIAIWKYMKLVFKGRKVGKPGDDYRQLGGDVLIDPDGVVQLHHISTSPHDRPAVNAILKRVRSDV